MRFEMASGSVVGASHLRAGRNGQDGCATITDGDITVIVVTDGCGSAPHSEVGAKLGARIVARELLACAIAGRPWSDAATNVADQLAAVAITIGDDRDQAILDYLLFTIVAAVVTPQSTTILSAGDGVFALNGARTLIGPFAGNAPPYLAYSLLDGVCPTFTVEAENATTDVKSILIGTDGAAPLAEDALFPFCSDDAIFRNPDAIRRRLFLLTRPRATLLDDDTTLIVMRRVA
jgi:hypothetical protein